MNAYLRRLATIQAQIQALQGLLPPAVSEAREAGASWQQIGDALGMTKQSAHKRFAEARPDIEQLPLTDPVFDVLFNTPQT